MTTEAVVKKVEDPDSQRRFLDGSRRSVATLQSAAVGRGEYLPGWRWSEHAAPQSGAPSRRHVGYVISGYLAVRAPGGQEILVGPGDAFEVPPGHDAWVMGDCPCIALDFAPVSQG